MKAALWILFAHFVIVGYVILVTKLLLLVIDSPILIILIVSVSTLLTIGFLISMMFLIEAVINRSRRKRRSRNAKYYSWYYKLGLLETMNFVNRKQVKNDIRWV